jgi:toxin ParE1/3/4
MKTYHLSNHAKEDLIRIHQYGILQFGEAQADQYFDNFLNALNLLPGFLNHLNQ